MDEHRRVFCLVVAGFAITFGILNLIVSAAHRGYWPYLYFGTCPGIHIHHFVFGIIIISVVGYLALDLNSPAAKKILALLYGSGLCLLFDEFGMWLELRENYPDYLRHAGICFVILAFLAIFLYREVVK